ncbi:uncharacterized protein K452DRAFT_314054 [Aplosporella prunicola CBS 121167]|uniref:Uncharacterized protein n=1 Tax=Aplosporella prunicola CBS 121167 TaxID=1176127 RepID=A0A6A6AWN9_9PEZI|nr:uncharacterized protein K452DRAFT_314054 [Aplosporella prunicola CBS 121167]KAF2135354.1 hypothetical protein K452DRAFT_314054 [Aplosporella prunicola CBS 121167]
MGRDGAKLFHSFDCLPLPLAFGDCRWRCFCVCAAYSQCDLATATERRGGRIADTYVGRKATAQAPAKGLEMSDVYFHIRRAEKIGSPDWRAPGPFYRSFVFTCPPNSPAFGYCQGSPSWTPDSLRSDRELGYYSSTQCNGLTTVPPLACTFCSHHHSPYSSTVDDESPPPL